jgi:hypothetical protein
MTAHRSPFDFESIDAWLHEWVDERFAHVASASRVLVEHAVEHVDRLVEDVVADASEVARRAADLFDDIVASFDEHDPN